MRNIITIILVLAFAALSVSAECSESDRKALEKFDKDWGSASQNGDRTALNAIYADDYRNIFGTETKAVAINNAIAQADRDKANPGKAAKITYGHYMITCTPNSATITHRNTIWVPAGTNGGPETLYSRSVHVLEKRNGRWQVVTNAGHGLDDQMELGYLQMDWIDAMKDRNATWYEKNLAPDYITANFMTGDVLDKKGAVEFIRTNKTKFDSAEILDMDIRVNGNTAVITGVGHGVGTDPNGERFERKVRFMDTVVKRDGKWMPIASQIMLMPESRQTAKN